MWPALFKGGSLFSSIAWRDAAVAAAMTIGGLAIAATGAEAAPSPGCVTKTEYRQVHRGDTLKRVARIFDTPGLRVSIAAYGGLKCRSAITAPASRIRPCTSVSTKSRAESSASRTSRPFGSFEHYRPAQARADGRARPGHPAGLSLFPKRPSRQLRPLAVA